MKWKCGLVAIAICVITQDVRAEDVVLCIQRIHVDLTRPDDKLNKQVMATLECHASLDSRFYGRAKFGDEFLVVRGSIARSKAFPEKYQIELACDHRIAPPDDDSTRYTVGSILADLETPVEIYQFERPSDSVNPRQSSRAELHESLRLTIRKPER